MAQRFPHAVALRWRDHPNWNLIGAWAIEHLGMPGDRYTTEFHADSLQWNFADARDQLIFTIAWGDDHGR